MSDTDAHDRKNATSQHKDRDRRENGGKSRRRRHSSSSSDEGSRHRSNKHKKSHRNPDKRRRSRSRDRSRRHSSRSSRERYSSHRRHRRRSPPRRRSRSSSPPVYSRAMEAQERLARQLDRAKRLMKIKREVTRKEEKSTSDRLNEAVKKATQMVNDSTVNVSYEGMSAAATAHVEALRAKAFAETGIEVPAYYNALAINPMNYAQQAAKRKKLWAKKDDEDTTGNNSAPASTLEKTAIWSGVKFGDDKSNEKFAKLMGIKGDHGKDGAIETSEIVKKQAEVFQNLDMQYQQARLTTHTQRGVGLGFSSTYIDPNLPGASK